MEREHGLSGEGEGVDAQAGQHVDEKSENQGLVVGLPSYGSHISYPYEGKVVELNEEAPSFIQGEGRFLVAAGGSVEGIRRAFQTQQDADDWISTPEFAQLASRAKRLDHQPH